MTERERLKKAIWIYFWLLLFEGALRRWVLPSLASPLLLVRDVVAILILVYGARGGLLAQSPLPWGGVILGILSFLATICFGHGDVFVALFGLRIIMLHIPLIYIIGKALDVRDACKIGRAMCVVAAPMLVLIALQFFLPQSHLVNVGIGGEGTAGYGATEDRFRPPGTFSFTSGLSQFYILVGAFVAGLPLVGRNSRRWWWIGGAISTIMAVPLSISRGLLFQLAVTFVLFLLVGLSQPRLLKTVFVVVGVLLVLGFAAMQVPGGDTAISAFATRWSDASEVEGGVISGTLGERFLGEFGSTFSNLGNIPFAGFGLGLGTNVGAKLLSGERGFLLSEGEWGRIVAEMGPVLGLAFLALRVGMAVGLLQVSVRSWKLGNALPIILSSVAILWVAQGNWAQPTSLGFSVLAGGLVLAAARMPDIRRSERLPSGVRQVGAGEVESGLSSSEPRAH